ncbi:MAG: S-layer homology domain-containing protein, partial [Evtepia sp.]
MKQRWRRLLALGLTLCLALSILAMPAQAVQLETEDPADQIQAEETLAPAEEETQPVDEPETTEAENEDLALLPEEEEEAPVIPAQTRQVPALLTAHVRYMEGFPEGTFQPDKQLTRAQAAQM